MEKSKQKTKNPSPRIQRMCLLIVEKETNLPGFVRKNVQDPGDVSKPYLAKSKYFKMHVLVTVLKYSYYRIRFHPPLMYHTCSLKSFRAIKVNISMIHASSFLIYNNAVSNPRSICC